VERRPGEEFFEPGVLDLGLRELQQP
jgi:hypothetical protein